MNWYYVDQGQQVGPVNDAEFAELVRAGKIRPDTLVWRQGTAGWVPCREVQIPSPGPDAGYTPGEAPEAVCAGCGKLYAIRDMIHHGEIYLCAKCNPAFMQKLAEGARLNTCGLNYAGFWLRFAAKLVDGLILGAPFAIVFFLVLLPLVSADLSGGLALLLILLPFGLILVQMAYQIFFLGKYGATPGKMACKIKVVTADGGQVGYGRAAGRFFAEMLSGMICLIGYIIAAFDGQKRALHDRLCGTRVVFK